MTAANHTYTRAVQPSPRDLARVPAAASAARRLAGRHPGGGTTRTLNARMMTRLRSVAALALVAVPLAACTAGEAKPVSRTITVTMKDDGGKARFEPANVEVRRGDIVRFVQEGGMPHNVQFVRNNAPAGVELGDTWSGPYLSAKGETYEVQVDERFADGSYEFVCAPHVAMGMKGALVVAGGTPAAAPSAAAKDERPVIKGVQGLQPLAYEMDGNTKVFRLTAEKIQWETKEGKLVEAMAYNRMVPGPVIRATEGDRVRIIVTNGMDEPHTTHWHGMWLPNNMDGVPGISQDPIMPGDSFTYEFTANPAGTRLYHSHFNAMTQESSGLYGMFIVEERDPAPRMRADSEAIMLLSDGPLGFTINGKEFPMTEPMKVKMGERMRVRIANLGSLTHPMHLHGSYGLVVAKDGFELASPRRENTFTVNPGETLDVILAPTSEEGMFAGTWIWHCHVLSHATGPRDADGNETAAGMIGVVQVDDGHAEMVDMANHKNH